MDEQQSISFENDIRPLFREIDMDHMRGFDVFLGDYDYMSKRENAVMVRDFLSGQRQPQMPPGGPFWPQEHLDLLERWIVAGCPK